jgi:hypothetical protein
MASTYSALKIQLMATGENSGTWGNVTNDNLGVAIEEAIAESADVAFSGSNVSITLSDTNASQTARNLRLNLTGTSVAATQALTVPDIEKPYIVNNGLTDDVEVMNSTGCQCQRQLPSNSRWLYAGQVFRRCGGFRKYWSRNDHQPCRWHCVYSHPYG